MKNITLPHAKFPTRGQLLDFFIKVLEIENVNSADRKRYQRFIKEENISIEEYNEILNLYIDRILDELILDKTKHFSAKKTINEFLEKYLLLIQEIEVYPYTQECIDKILVKHIYLPFLIFFNQYYLGIDTNLFLISDETPLNDIFNFFKVENNIDNKEFKQYLFEELDKITNKSKDDKTLNQSILNWLNNKTFPNIKNIDYLSEIFSKKLSKSKDELKQYFIVAKIIKNSKISKEIIFKENLTIKSEKELKKYILECESQYQDIVESVVEIYNLTNIKQEKTKDMEKRFLFIYNKLKENGFNENEMPYLAWVKARYCAQKKKFKEATKYYKLALINGKNAMGKYYIDIIKEGLIVSAQITREKQLDLTNAKSPFIRFYKEAYFLKLIDSNPDELKQYFLNDMKKKFPIYFTKLYPDIDMAKTTLKIHELGIIHTPDLSKIKLDLKNPNKWIRNKLPSPITQLMFFSYYKFIDYKKVKKLLDAGADANIIRNNDNATALIMVLQNTSEEKREDIIKIAKLLISKMSKEALCAKLPKTKMTALGLAIDLGLADIVKSLIKKGADINQIITLNDVSPLYYTIQKIAESKIDFDTFKNKLYHYPKRREELLRVVKSMPSYVPCFNHAITDQEKIDALLEQLHDNNPIHKAINEKVLQFLYKQTKKYLNEYYKIFNLILEAKPNLEIKARKEWHTVLMLATEINEVELVKKLLKAGANKNPTQRGRY